VKQDRSSVIVDGEALIHAKQRSAQAFEQIVKHYRALGVSDRDLAQAMAGARTLVSPLRLRAQERR
jgi:hypothetical protein